MTRYLFLSALLPLSAQNLHAGDLLGRFPCNTSKQIVYEVSRQKCDGSDFCHIELSLIQAGRQLSKTQVADTRAEPLVIPGGTISEEEDWWSISHSDDADEEQGNTLVKIHPLPLGKGEDGLWLEATEVSAEEGVPSTGYFLYSCGNGKLTLAWPGPDANFNDTFPFINHIEVSDLNRDGASEVIIYDLVSEGKPMRFPPQIFQFDPATGKMALTTKLTFVPSTEESQLKEQRKEEMRREKEIFVDKKPFQGSKLGDPACKGVRSRVPPGCDPDWSACVPKKTGEVLVHCMHKDKDWKGFNESLRKQDCDQNEMMYDPHRASGWIYSQVLCHKR
ncbi:MAG: hypothetical protein HY928_05985 [Elusimicrobia bacterium]|nr:hypothetical protein [Elusimicrobiota bacterium]